MDKYEEYRRQADYCEKMAHKANTLDARASWLRLADKWLALAVSKYTPEQSENSITAQLKKPGYKDSSSTD
jgi:hypothetical protein